MLKLGIFALTLAAATASAANVTVETASGDWSKLPQLRQRGYNHLNEKMQAKLYEIAQSKQCPAFRLKQERLDFSITFAVQYAANGSLSRIVLPKMDCPQAESVVGGALLEMVQARDYAPGGTSEAGWYKGGLAFSFAGTGNFVLDPAIPRPAQPQIAKKGLDPDEVLCERVEEIGTRLGGSRVCMTRAQWAEQRRLNREEVDRVQTRRDCGPLGTSC